MNRPQGGPASASSQAVRQQPDQHRPADQPGVEADPLDSQRGGPPDSSRRARIAALREHLPFGLVLLVAVTAIVRIVQYHWREGSALLGGALLLAAVLRAILPERRAGLIGVRSRVVDVFSYLALAGCVLFIASTIQGGPLS